ncbi:hypothetical protein ACWGKX_38955, partial [Streptomyces tricolor]
MSPDLDLTGAATAARTPLRTLLALDGRLFEAAAAWHWPGAERVLPRLSRSANHGVLWWATGAPLAAGRPPRGPRGAAPGGGAGAQPAR